MLPQDAVKRLIEGNERFVNDLTKSPNRTSYRREEVKGKQNPFAVILGCSDSRVPPEIIFDQGLGDLFVVRVAGNVIDFVQKESIDFAIQVLGTSLIMVLGHESCGAVGAVYQNKGSDFRGLEKLIKPSIQGAKNLKEAVCMNIDKTCKVLKESSSLKNLLGLNKVKVVGAYYRLQTGRVEIISD